VAVIAASFRETFPGLFAARLATQSFTCKTGRSMAEFRT
jgi:hypothetical protein